MTQLEQWLIISVIAMPFFFIGLMTKALIETAVNIHKSIKANSIKRKRITAAELLLGFYKDNDLSNSNYPSFCVATTYETSGERENKIYEAIKLLNIDFISSECYPYWFKPYDWKSRKDYLISIISNK